MEFLELLKSYFTPEVIASIISCITAIGALLKVVSTLKVERKSSDDIAKSCEKVAKETAKDISKEYQEEHTKELEFIKKSLITFAKSFMLMQQQDSSSKIAILKLIEDLGACDKNEIKNIESVILKQEQEKTKEEQKVKEELKEIEYEGRY